MVVLDRVYFIWEAKKWPLVALDRCSTYIVTIVSEFAWAGSTLVILDEWFIEVVVWTGLTVQTIPPLSVNGKIISNFQEKKQSF